MPGPVAARDLRAREKSFLGFVCTPTLLLLALLRHGFSLCGHLNDRMVWYERRVRRRVYIIPKYNDHLSVK